MKGSVVDQRTLDLIATDDTRTGPMAPEGVFDVSDRKFAKEQDLAMRRARRERDQKDQRQVDRFQAAKNRLARQGGPALGISQLPSPKRSEFANKPQVRVVVVGRVAPRRRTPLVASIACLIA